MHANMTYKLDHIGIPTNNPQKGESYMADAKCFSTEVADCPMHIEFLRPEKGCTLPKILLEKPHISLLVESLDEALKGEKILVEPFIPIPTRRIAFIDIEGCLIELAEDISKTK